MKRSGACDFQASRVQDFYELLFQCSALTRLKGKHEGPDAWTLANVLPRRKFDRAGEP